MVAETADFLLLRHATPETARTITVSNDMAVRYSVILMRAEELVGFEDHKALCAAPKAYKVG